MNDTPSKIPDRAEWLVRPYETCVKQLAQLSPFYLKTFLQEDLICLKPSEADRLFRAACPETHQEQGEKPFLRLSSDPRQLWRRVRELLFGKALAGLDSRQGADWNSVLVQWVEMEKDIHVLESVAGHPRWASREGWAAAGEPLLAKLKQTWQEAPAEQVPWTFYWWAGVWEKDRTRRITAGAEGLYQHFRHLRQHLPSENQEWKRIVATMKNDFASDLPLIRHVWVEKLPHLSSPAAFWNAVQQVGGGEIERQICDWLRKGLTGQRPCSETELMAASRWKPQNPDIAEEVHLLWETELQRGARSRRCLAAAALLCSGEVKPHLRQSILHMMKQGDYPFLSALSGWEEVSIPAWSVEFTEGWEAVLKSASARSQPDLEFIWAAIRQHIPETPDGNKQVARLLEITLKQISGRESLDNLATSLLRHRLPAGMERDQLYQTALKRLPGVKADKKPGWFKLLLALLPETAGEATTTPLRQEMESLAGCPEGLSTLQKITSEFIEIEKERGAEPSPGQSLMQDFWENQLHQGPPESWRPALDCLRQMAKAFPHFVPTEKGWNALKDRWQQPLSPGLLLRVHGLEKQLMTSHPGLPCGHPLELWKGLLIQEVLGSGETSRLARLLREGMLLSHMQSWWESHANARCDLMTFIVHFRQQCCLWSESVALPADAHEQDGGSRVPPRSAEIVPLWNALWEELKAVYERESGFGREAPRLPDLPGVSPWWEYPRRDGGNPAEMQMHSTRQAENTPNPRKGNPVTFMRQIE